MKTATPQEHSCSDTPIPEQVVPGEFTDQEPTFSQPTGAGTGLSANNAELPRPRAGGLVHGSLVPRPGGRSRRASIALSPAGVIDQAHTGDRAPAHTRAGSYARHSVWVFWQRPAPPDRGQHSLPTHPLHALPALVHRAASLPFPSPHVPTVDHPGRRCRGSAGHAAHAGAGLPLARSTPARASWPAENADRAVSARATG